eukprot:CAMPEP_0202729368 /NCGR_PEP_ID=MMETSP1385-20130828/186095_1 /ASSEMBLY_ACC=CAM_ASM_000861 /TAXON_ID=933848 /ORGANISM="Elphidium margaritaceum" /LENGTH=1060 /DNA_ID=CAMNT_0049395629 /DNA_START=51 /DNA_END=3237 /DNA_ORIENTATION=+
MKKMDDVEVEGEAVACTDAVPELEEPVFIVPPVYGAIDYKISQPTWYCEPHLVRSNEITPGVTRTEYECRRERLFRVLPKCGMLLLPCNPESRFSADAKYPYRQDASFAYFTGLHESHSLAVLTKDVAGNCRFVLFVRAIIETDVTWHGRRCGLEAAQKYFGANESYDFIKDRDVLIDMMQEYGRVLLDQSVNESLTHFVLDAQTDKKGKHFRILKSAKLIQQIRVRKSEAEIALLRQSAEIASYAMMETMQFCRPGMLESELSVQFEHSCRVRGAARLSFECSVASGANACHLYYFNNNSLLRADQLCLVDCGAEFNGYASDITRTFPVNGTFNAAQRELYEMVLQVSDKLIAKMRVGFTAKKLESECNKLIKTGLKRLGVCNALTAQQYKELKLSCSDVHFVTHFLGLDIHDTAEIPQGRAFEGNMVLAVEPAVYIPDHPSIPPKYRNIGIRIEDDVLITPDGPPMLLTHLLPRTVEQIEACMRMTSVFPRITPFSLLSTDADAEAAELVDMDGVDDADAEAAEHVDMDGDGDVRLSSSQERDNGGGDGTSEVRKNQLRDTGHKCDVEAATLLSQLRFASAKEETHEQRRIGRQRQWFRLLQQAVFECECSAAAVVVAAKRKKASATAGRVNAACIKSKPKAAKLPKLVKLNHHINKLQSRPLKSKSAVAAKCTGRPRRDTAAAAAAAASTLSSVAAKTVAIGQSSHVNDHDHHTSSSPSLLKIPKKRTAVIRKTNEIHIPRQNNSTHHSEQQNTDCFVVDAMMTASDDNSSISVLSKSSKSSHSTCLQSVNMPIPHSNLLPTTIAKKNESITTPPTSSSSSASITANRFPFANTNTKTNASSSTSSSSSASITANRFPFANANTNASSSRKRKRDQIESLDAWDAHSEIGHTNGGRVGVGVGNSSSSDGRERGRYPSKSREQQRMRGNSQSSEASASTTKRRYDPNRYYYNANAYAYNYHHPSNGGVDYGYYGYQQQQQQQQQNQDPNEHQHPHQHNFQQPPPPHHHQHQQQQQWHHPYYSTVTPPNPWAMYYSSSSSPNEESAYEAFMAKSNNKTT